MLKRCSRKVPIRALRTSFVSPLSSAVLRQLSSSGSDGEHDVEKLIEKTEKEGDQQEEAGTGGLSFAFAKVWAADKDAMEDIPEDPQENSNQGDSWAQTLQRIAAERDKEIAKEVTGRGAKRRAAMIQVRQAIEVVESQLIASCSKKVISTDLPRKHRTRAKSENQSLLPTTTRTSIASPHRRQILKKLMTLSLNPQTFWRRSLSRATRPLTECSHPCPSCLLSPSLTIPPIVHMLWRRTIPITVAFVTASTMASAT